MHKTLAKGPVCSLACELAEGGDALDDRLAATHCPNRFEIKNERHAVQGREKDLQGEGKGLSSE